MCRIVISVLSLRLFGTNLRVMASGNAEMQDVSELEFLMEQRNGNGNPRDAAMALPGIAVVVLVPTLSSERPKTRPCPASHFARTSARASSLVYPS